MKGANEKSSIDLAPADLEVVRSILATHLPDDVGVLAFGSRAKWTAKEFSDLDLALKSNAKLPSHLLADLNDAFSESDLPIKVDVLDWHAVAPSFQAIIDRDGVEVRWKDRQTPKAECGRMGEWRPSTWGDEVTLNYGKAIRGYQNATKGFRVYGSNGPVGWHDEALSQGPGVILGRKGAYRGVEFSREPFFVIDTAYYVTPKGEMDMRWLYYAIKHHRLGEIDDGSPIPSTTRSAVYTRDFDVPEVEEQKAIANVLSSLDDKINLNRRMNATLEGMAQAIFRDWFVDFGPVRRKMAVAQQGLAGDAVAILGGLIPDPTEAASLAPLFPDTLGDDGLPVGWALSTLDSMLNLAYGKSLPKTVRADGDIPVYGSGGVGGFHNEALVKGPGIIVGRKGTVGSLFWEPDDFFPIDTVFYVETKAGYSLSFLWPLLQTMGLEGMNTDAAVPGLNRNNAHRLEVVRPSQPVLNACNDLAGLLRQRLDACNSENRTLAETRDYLLPRLMSGKVRVADAEGAVA